MSDQKIILLRRRPENSREKTGLGIYSDNVEDILTEAGIPYGVIYVRMDLKAGYLALIREGLIGPMRQIKKTRDPEAVYHISDELLGTLAFFIKGRLTVTVHHVVDKRISSRKFMFLWNTSTKTVCRKSTFVIAASPQTKRDLVKVMGIPEEKIVTFYSQIRSVFTPKDVQRERIIGGVGQLSDRKNFADLIRAFALFRKMSGTEGYRLVICGKGPLREELLRLADELGVKDETEILSDLTTDEVVEFYNKVSVLANPSMQEGLGLVTLEAQKCNAPVVCFENADIPKDVTRYAVPAKDVKGFAEAIYRLVTDEAYRDGVVHDGKEYADSFGTDFKDNLLNLYRSL